MPTTGTAGDGSEASRRMMEVAWYWPRSLLYAYCGRSSEGPTFAEISSDSATAAAAAATSSTCGGRARGRSSALRFAGFAAELAEAEGFEPSYADPKSAVLPLDDASEPLRRTGVDPSCVRSLRAVR